MAGADAGRVRADGGVMGRPECGSPDTIILRAVDPTRPFGPGERAHYACQACGELFTGIVPEPTDEQMGYLGDGVFAENH